MADEEEQPAVLEVAPRGEEGSETPVAGGSEVLELIAKLDALGDGASYTASLLRESYRAQRDVITWLSTLSSRTDITLREIDAALLRWLHACYVHVSSVPGLAASTLPLAPIMAVAGLLEPFIAVQNGSMMVGLPSNEDAVADTLSELVRVAGAAIVCYGDYLTRSPAGDSLPSDDSALLFASMAIRSCQSELAVEAIEAQIKEAAAFDLKASSSSGAAAVTEAPDPAAAGAAAAAPSPSGAPLPDFASLSEFGVAEIRWLMHFIRAHLSQYFAAVKFVVDDQQGHKESLVAAQQDKLCLLKLVPNNLSSYVWYCRACLQFQQTKAAHIFSTKGLVVADALRDDARKAQLLLVHATATALGGAGPDFSWQQVTEEHDAAMAAKAACLAWLPEQFHGLLDLDPELTILTTKVLPDASATADEHGRCKSLTALYTVPEPTSLPPGAVEAEEDAEEQPVAIVEEAAAGTGAGRGAARGGSTAGKRATAQRGRKK